MAVSDSVANRDTGSDSNWMNENGKNVFLKSWDPDLDLLVVVPECVTPTRTFRRKGEIDLFLALIDSIPHWRRQTKWVQSQSTLCEILTWWNRMCSWRISYIVSVLLFFRLWIVGELISSGRFMCEGEKTGITKQKQNLRSQKTRYHANW